MFASLAGSCALFSSWLLLKSGKSLLGTTGASSTTFFAKLFTVDGAGLGVALAFEELASFNSGISFSFSFLRTGKPLVGVFEKNPRIEDWPLDPTLLPWRFKVGVREGVVVSDFFAFGGILTSRWAAV